MPKNRAHRSRLFLRRMVVPVLVMETDQAIREVAPTEEEGVRASHVQLNRQIEKC